MAMTRRIYFGPPGHERAAYWTVKISRARKPVLINGSVLHALKAHAGVTIGCALSLTATDPANKRNIPHPVFLASFTKSSALLVDRLKKDGTPMHAVWYGHSYPWIVEQNDKGTLKELVKEDPSLMEREFALRPPRLHRPGVGGGGARTGKGTNRATATLHRGAMARAVSAGIIGKHVAEQMVRVSED